MLRSDKKHIRLVHIKNYMGLFDKLKRTDPKVKNSEELDELLRQKNYNKALELQERFFDKENPNDWYTKGIILENLQKTKHAIECYSKTIQLDDSYSEAWFKLGLFRFNEGDFKRASEAFAKTPILDKPIHYTKWNPVAGFYYMMSLYMQYLDSHDKLLRHKVSREITKLRPIIEFKEDSEDKFLAFCSKNFKDIVKNLQPYGSVDFTKQEI